MELREYRDSILSEIKSNAMTNCLSEIEVFLEYISDIFIESEEFEDQIIYSPYEGAGKGNKKIHIDGYLYNEFEEQLSIFVVTPLSVDDVETLRINDVDRYYKRARNFIEQAQFIEENAEPSGPSYGLVYDLNREKYAINKYRIYILTDQVMSKNIDTIKPEDIKGRPVELHIWDLNRIISLLESQQGKEAIVINICEYMNDGLACLPASKTEDYTAYLCNIPGTILAKLYNEYGSRLLEGNVRSFLQVRGKVNKGIRNTILNEPEMFFAYNNGITATARNLVIKETAKGKFITEIEDLQIVNGGQTTASIAMSYLKDNKDNSMEKIKNIYVPMKLSVVTPEKAEFLIPNISRYANSQNKVSEADLWSNHPFHIRMEEYSRKIAAPAVNGKQYGTNWYYERANGQYRQATYKLTTSQKNAFIQRNPKNQMFTKTDLAKFMNIQMMLPHVASAGGQKSFAKFAEYVVKQWEKKNTVFNEGYFKKVVAMAIIFKTADKIVKNQSWYNSYKANIVAYTIAKILYTINADYPEYSVNYWRIWQKQGLSKAWENQIISLSKIIYEFLISDSREVENVTEWAKRLACWEEAKKIKFSLNPAFVKELISMEAVKKIESEEIDLQKDINKIDMARLVIEYSEKDIFKRLDNWIKEHGITLSYVNQKSLNKALLIKSRGKIPTDREYKSILEMLDYVKEEGFSI